MALALDRLLGGKMSEGNQIDALTSSYGLSQLTREPTHILPNSSSCIDQSK